MLIGLCKQIMHKALYICAATVPFGIIVYAVAVFRPAACSLAQALHGVAAIGNGFAYLPFAHLGAKTYQIAFRNLVPILFVCCIHVFVVSDIAEPCLTV